MDLFLYGILSLLMGGVFALLLPEKWKVPIFAAFSLAGSVLVFIPAFLVLFSNRPLSAGSGFFLLRTDAAGAYFQMLFSAAFFFISAYAAGYVKRAKKSADVSFTFFFMDLFAICLLLLTAAGNAAAFLFLWQAMILVVFFSVLSGRGKQEGFQSGMRILAQLEAGFVLILTAMTFLAWKAGSPMMDAFSAFAGTLSADGLLIVFFIGFASCAAWLPKSVSGGFLPLDAVLTTLLSSAGIFGFVRAMTFLPNNGLVLAGTVIFLSAFAAVFGAVRSSRQKELFAFLSGDNVLSFGLAGLGIGIGLAGTAFKSDMTALLGFASALFQIVNHAFAKSLAYFAAGSAFYSLRAVPLGKNYGIIRSKHSSSFYLVVSMMALLGLPLLNGFANFFMIAVSAASVPDRGLFTAVVMPALVVGIAVPLLRMVPVHSRIVRNLVFEGTGKEKKSVMPGRFSSGLASVCMTVLTLVSGLFPQFVAIFAVNPASNLAKIAPVFSDHTVLSVFSSLFNSLNMVSKSLLIFLGLIFLLYFIRVFALTKKEFDGGRN